jgi:hypothetical protein
LALQNLFKPLASMMGFYTNFPFSYISLEKIYPKNIFNAYDGKHIARNM